MTLFERLESVPPCYVRLLARSNGKGMSHDDIAKRSGLSVATIGLISMQTSWDNMTVKTAKQFCKACGVNPLQMKQHRHYLRRCSMSFVGRSHPTQQEFYNRLLVIVTECLTKGK